MNYSYTYLILSFMTLVNAGCKQNNASNGKPSSGNEPRTPLEMVQTEIRLYPDSLLLRTQLIDLLREKGEYKSALQEMDTVLKKDSLNPSLHHYRAEILLDMKDSAAATTSFEKAFTLAPGSDVQYSLAYLYAASGNPKALALCDTMIRHMTRQNPKGDPYYIKGIYFLRLGQNDEALKFFNQSINTDHSLMEAYIEKGRLFYHQDKFREALNVFKLASTVSNSYADAYFWQGKCQEALGQKEDALQNYQKAVGLDPEYRQAREAMKKLSN